MNEIVPQGVIDRIWRHWELESKEFTYGPFLVEPASDGRFMNGLIVEAVTVAVIGDQFVSAKSVIDYALTPIGIRTEWTELPIGSVGAMYEAWVDSLSSD